MFTTLQFNKLLTFKTLQNRKQCTLGLGAIEKNFFSMVFEEQQTEDVNNVLPETSSAVVEEKV